MIDLDSPFHYQTPDAPEERLTLFWKQFNDEFPTEAHCLEELYRRAEEEGLLRCGRCGNTDIHRKYGDRTGRCGGCKRKTWLTAGTFFHRIRAARPWLAAIWLMEHGVIINSLRFQKLVDIAYSSALSIFKKLTTVIHRQMGEEAIVVPSLSFCGLVSRRSRETPARAHPIAEQERIERESDVETSEAENAIGDQDTRQATLAVPAARSAEGRRSASDRESTRERPETNRNGEEGEEPDGGFELSDLESRIFALLSPEPIQFDDLCALARIPTGELSATLTMLELAGGALRMPGDRYVRGVGRRARDGGGIVRRPGCTRDSTSNYEDTKVVEAIIGFIRAGFQGISRKYLQNYLAAHWCHADRIRWGPASLFKACLESRPLTYADVLTYVPPLMVKMSPI